MNSRRMRECKVAALAAHNQSIVTIRRMLKLVALSVNEELGCGKKSIMRIINRINELSKLAQEDEVFWGHVDIRVIDQIGIEINREKDG